MTKDSDSYDIPTSLNDLVYNKSILLIANKRTEKGFMDVNKTIHENNSTLKNIFRTTFDKSNWYIAAWALISRIAYSGKEYQELYWCEVFPTQFELVRENSRNNFKNLKTGEILSPNCTLLNRFALIYATKLIFKGYEYQLSIYHKLLYLLYGEYLLIENNEPVVLVHLHIWYIDDMNYLGDLFNKRIASLSESGIHAYQKHYFELINQLHALKQFLRTNNFNESWGFYLANAMVSKYISLGWYTSASRRLSELFINGQNNDGIAKSGSMTDFR